MNKTCLELACLGRLVGTRRDANHHHEAAHTAPLPHPGRRWWDGSHFRVPKSPLEHHYQTLTQKHFLKCLARPLRVPAEVTGVPQQAAEDHGGRAAPPSADPGGTEPCCDRAA
jgi:hypothetical protein